MTAHIDSYYSRTLAAAPERPPLAGTVDADVCVVGGGLAGMAVALGLAERGKKVAVLEGRRLGWGASGRNGGFVLSGFAAGEQSIIDRAGLGNARALYALTKKAQRTIRERIKKFNIPCDPVDGHLKCSWFDDPDMMRKKVDFLRENFGESIDFMPREQVREICRTGKYYDAWFYPESFHMHALNYVNGLARAVEDKGGRIFEKSMATGLTETGAVHTVTTDKGAVRAGDIVFCGSAYFNGMEKKLSRSCLPVSTYVMVTDPIDPAVLKAAITRPYAIRDTRWSDDYYRTLPDHRILWGGRVGLGHSVPGNLTGLMLGDLLKIYPQLKGHVNVATAWAGVMGYTVHKMPHVGKLRPGVWACTNFGGNGLGPTTAGGEVIAAAIAAGDETYRLFEPFGYEWTGGLLGPVVAQAVYHSWEVRDRFYEFRTGCRQRKVA